MTKTSNLKRSQEEKQILNKNWKGKLEQWQWHLKQSLRKIQNYCELIKDTPIFLNRKVSKSTWKNWRTKSIESSFSKHWIKIKSWLPTAGNWPTNTLYYWIPWKTMRRQLYFARDPLFPNFQTCKIRSPIWEGTFWGSRTQVMNKNRIKNRR